MSVALALTGHNRDLGGGFKVRRMLPSAQKQSVGPFLFFDHFGPMDVAPGHHHDVRPHPHIGLATVTYLYEGAIMHRDSLGSVQRIEPGAINWMTAGNGIVHSERTPPDCIGVAHCSHGLQLWAALPRSHEETVPLFAHTPAAAIPVLDVGGAGIKLLAGRAFGAESPVATLSETLYLDIVLPAGTEMPIEALAPERALYVLDGAITVDGTALQPHVLAVLEPGRVVRIAATGAQAVHLVLIGGEPLDGHRFMWWNFVSSRKERIIQASEDWEAQRMPRIPDETDWIPLPEKRFA